MHGMYLLWWVQERHVSPAAVATILAAGDLALTALEVPTGWLADRYGHRASLLAGSILQVIGTLYCWLGQGIPGLLTASVLIACGDAFRSGADQALLYRTCLALDRESDFQRIQSRTQAATLAALVALLLTGGALVGTWGFALAWLVETTLALAGLFIACAMVEPPTGGPGTSSEIGSVTDATAPRQFIRAIPMLAALIVPAAWLGGTAGAASFLAQTSSWANAERTTMLVAIATLAEAAGALLARRLTADIRSQLILGGVGTSMMVTALLLPPTFLPAIVGLSLVVGIAEPLRATAIQRLSADHVRARAASIASACDKVVATVLLIVAGVLSRRR
jgi:MFS family permease